MAMLGSVSMASGSHRLSVALFLHGTAEEGACVTEVAGEIV